jgi:hypothetical protein
MIFDFYMPGFNDYFVYRRIESNAAALLSAIIPPEFTFLLSESKDRLCFRMALKLLRCSRKMAGYNIR